MLMLMLQLQLDGGVVMMVLVVLVVMMVLVVIAAAAAADLCGVAKERGAVVEVAAFYVGLGRRVDELQGE